jgi:hypothetical protein
MLTATSQFLGDLLECFDENDFKYCIERNYDEYPEVITGDVDFLVNESTIPQAIELVVRLSKASGVRVYYCYSWAKAGYVGLLFPESSERAVLTLEFFASACWHGLSYLDAQSILDERVPHRKTWKPRPAHQSIITSVHHILYNKRMPEKYRNELAELVARDELEFDRQIENVFGLDIMERLKVLIQNRDKTYSDLWFQMRLRLLKYSLVWNLRGALRNLFIGYFARIGVRHGAQIHLESNLPADVGLALIEYAVKWHVLLPPSRKIFPVVSGFGRIFQKLKITNVLRSGGIAVVLLESSEIQSNLKLQYVIVSQNGRLVLRKAARWAGEEAQVFNLGDSKTMAEKAWRAILLDFANGH